MPLHVYHFLMISAIYVLVGWGIYLNYRNGQLCFTPFISMIIGAYFTALVSRDFSWPVGLVLLGAVAIGAGFAFISGLFLARLESLPMSLVTIAVIFVIQTVIRNLDYLGGIPGIYYIPSVPHLMPITLVATVVIGFFIYRLDHSRFGRAIEVTSVDREAAASLGVNLYWTSVSLQVASGAIGGFAGSAFAFLSGHIYAESFRFSTLVLLICFMFVGGHATMWGLVLATPLLYGLLIILPSSVATWGNVIFGALLIIILNLRPEGIITKNTLRFFSARKKRSPLLE